MDDRLRSNSSLNPFLDEPCYITFIAKDFQWSSLKCLGWHVSVCFVYVLSKLLFPKREVFARFRRFAGASPIKFSR